MNGSKMQGGWMAIKLLQALEDLGNEELKEFKWFLQQSDFLKHFPSIPRSRLENADRLDTVNLMVQTYSYRCGDVVRTVFKKMRRNDLVMSLSNKSSKLTDVTEETLQHHHTSTQVTLSRCVGQEQTEMQHDNMDSDSDIILTDEWEIISPDECLNCPSSPYVTKCTGLNKATFTCGLVSSCL